MKIKLKLTVEQLNNLIIFATQFIKYGEINLSVITFTNLEHLNLKYFIHYGLKQLVNQSINNIPVSKIKTFSIDINQLEALKVALTIEYNHQRLSPLNLALYIDIQEQLRKQIRVLNNSLNLH